jgi:site-specific DNA-cytosine methylase
MNVLELFSGTGSVGKCCEQLGWNVVSVDMILPATHKVDIMDFDYKQYPKDFFSIVWGSPPCTNYSLLKKCWFGRKLKDGSIYTKERNDIEQDEGDKLVLKTLEIIDYFNPDYYFIENPQTGNLKNRDIMKDKPYYDVDYCMYSDWGYRKRTRIWTNKKDFSPKLCNGNCGNMVGSLHKTNLGNSGSARRANLLNVKKYTGTSQQDRYRIPEDLIFSLFMS